MRLNIKTYSGRLLTMEASPTTLVRFVVDNVLSFEKLPVDQRHMTTLHLLDGRELEPVKLLKDYSITDSTTTTTIIHLMRLSTGLYDIDTLFDDAPPIMRVIRECSWGLSSTPNTPDDDVRRRELDGYVRFSRTANRPDDNNNNDEKKKAEEEEREKKRWEALKRVAMRMTDMGDEEFDTPWKVELFLHDLRKRVVTKFITARMNDGEVDLTVEEACLRHLYKMVPPSPRFHGISRVRRRGAPMFIGGLIVIPFLGDDEDDDKNDEDQEEEKICDHNGVVVEFLDR